MRGLFKIHAQLETSYRMQEHQCNGDNQHIKHIKVIKVKLLLI